MSQSAIVAIARFCLISLVIYIALSYPWPNVRSAYRSMFIAGATAIYQDFGEYGDVRFEAINTSDEDVDVTMQNVQKRTAGGSTIHSGRVGFTTTALALSLIAAMPVSWRRKILCLLVGFAAAQLFVVARLGLYLAYVYSQKSPFQLFAPNATLGSILKISYEFLFNAPGGTVIAAVVIWLCVAVRAKDVEDILGLSDTVAPPNS